MSGKKELYTHIRSFTATMEEKDMDEFYQEAEKGVFKVESRIDINLSHTGYFLCKYSAH